MSEMQNNADFDKIAKRVIKVITENTDSNNSKDPISLNTKLREDLKVDSLDIYDIIMALETEFKIDIKEDDPSVASAESIEELVKIVMGSPSK